MPIRTGVRRVASVHECDVVVARRAVAQSHISSETRFVLDVIVTSQIRLSTRRQYARTQPSQAAQQQRVTRRSTPGQGFSSNVSLVSLLIAQLYVRFFDVSVLMKEKEHSVLRPIVSNAFFFRQHVPNTHF